jgi:hypothetical protein
MITSLSENNSTFSIRVESQGVKQKKIKRGGALHRLFLEISVIPIHKSVTTLL